MIQNQFFRNRAAPKRQKQIPLTLLLATFAWNAAAATPELLVGPAFPSSLSASEGVVVWDEIPADACPAPYVLHRFDYREQTLLNGCEVRPVELKKDDGYIYFFDIAGHRLAKMFDRGGAVITLASTAGIAFDQGNLALGPGHAYWGDDNGIHRVSKYGGTPQTIVFALAGYHNPHYWLAVDATHVYWVEGVQGARTIRRAGIAEPSSDILLSNLEDPAYLTVDDANIYWADPGARIRRMPKGGGDWTSYNSANSAVTATGLVVDNLNVYWSQSGPPLTDVVTLRKTPKLTTSIADLVTGRNGGYLAQDSHYLYYHDIEGIKRLPKDSGPVQVDFSLSDIEMTQGIQDLNNSVPLVQDKATAVRVFPLAQITGANQLSTTVVLNGSRNGSALPGSPLRPLEGNLPVTNNAGLLRGTPNGSFTFILPREWLHGAIGLRADINPGSVLPEANRANNSIGLTRSFTHKQPVCLIMQSLSTRDIPDIYTPRSPGFRDIIRRFQSLYPVADLHIQSITGVNGPWTIPAEGDGIIVSLVGEWLFSAEVSGCDPRTKAHLVGMVSPNASTGNQTGFANFVIPVSYVKMQSGGSSAFDAPTGGGTMAQEVVHNYNGWPYAPSNNDRWQHVACGTTNQINPNYPYPTGTLGPVGPTLFWGFDLISMMPIAPDAAKDFMSYCAPKWVSDYTWRGLFDNLQTVTAAALSSTMVNPSAAASDILYICGRITAEGKFDQLAPAYTLAPGMVGEKTLAAFASFQKEYTFPGASFSLEFVNGDGTVLLSQPFEPFPAETHDEDAKSRVFFLTLPASTKTARIVVKQGGNEIGAIKVSPNAPKVQLLSPKGGEKFDQDFLIQWAADDADGGDLFFTVEYSNNKGANWQALAHNIQGRELRQSVDSLPGGNDCLIRVIATDGVNSAMDTAAAVFTVSGHRPIAYLDEPAQGARVQAGNPFVLSGTGFDLEDEEITEEQLTWTVDSIFSGAGSQIIHPGLDPGLHQITLTVTDSSKLSTSSTVTILASLLPGPPQLKIEGFKTEFKLKWPAAAEGFVLETAEQLAPGTHWLPVKEAPALDGDSLTLTISNSDMTRFYRLIAAFPTAALP